MATFAGDVEVLGSEPPGAGWASGLEPPSAGWASGFVRVGPSRMRVDGSWMWLMKTPLGDGSHLAASLARKLAALLSLRGT